MSGMPPLHRMFTLGVVLTLAHVTGVPADEATARHVTVIETGGRLQYAIGNPRGVHVSTDDGATWTDRSSGLPHRTVYPFTGSERRRLTSIAVDPIRSNRLVVTTPNDIVLSESGGKDWKTVPSVRPVRGVDYFTAAALSPHDESTVYLGTSFNGLYVTRNSGATWSELSDPSWPTYRGAGFFEEIAAVAVSPENPAEIYLATGFDNLVYVSTDGGVSIRDMGFPGSGSCGRVAALHATSETVSQESGGLQLTVYGEHETWVHTGETWQRREDTPAGPSETMEDSSKADGRASQAADRHGIYVNAGYASGERLKTHLELLKAHGMNSLVVDMKDDEGRLTYDTELELPHALGAVLSSIRLDELVHAADEAGLYLIGRIVVFKDPVLYAYQDSAYAVWDLEQDAPWGHKVAAGTNDDGSVRYEQREFWVDPFADLVWEYNTAIARELQERGVDEVQFDYIRFPSDGDLSTATYRHRKTGMRPVDAIESFLRYAGERITVPISTDLYGFNSWYRMGNWIGQSIEMVADYVDVVCPMYYPSHFPGSFMGDMEYFDRAERIYSEGVRRARTLVGDKSWVRPYVQAFLLGKERRYEEPDYTEYLLRQLDGLTGAGSSGFTLWNASNIYYMVTRPLSEYTVSPLRQ